jgi:hypothetical protein
MHNIFDLYEHTLKVIISVLIVNSIFLSVLLNQLNPKSNTLAILTKSKIIRILNPVEIDNIF